MKIKTITFSNSMEEQSSMKWSKWELRRTGMKSVNVSHEKYNMGYIHT